MKKQKIIIDDIKAIIWGDTSKVIIALHGKGGNKEDRLIKTLVSKVLPKEYTVISFDLPNHGERINENYEYNYANIKNDFLKILNFANKYYKTIYLCAYSESTYLSLLVYENIKFEKVIWITPYFDFSIFIQKEKLLEINKWENNTYILYNQGNQENTNIVKDISNKFYCELTKIKCINDYIETDDEFEFYANWLSLIFT